MHKGLAPENSVGKESDSREDILLVTPRYVAYLQETERREAATLGLLSRAEVWL